MQDLACSIVSKKDWMSICVDRRTSGLEEIEAPIDVKFELIVALLVLMFATTQSYLGNN